MTADDRRFLEVVRIVNEADDPDDLAAALCKALTATGGGDQ